MSTSFGVAAVATLVALVLTGMLVQRCVRMPRLDLAALASAAAGTSVALAADALGSYRGFSPGTFRAVHLGAQLLAPMALAWALAELAGKSTGARFAARLALGGLTMVAAVVLASDPLSSTSFGKTWPVASQYYQLIPNAILELVAVVTALAAVIAAAIAAVRARRYPGWQDVFGAVVSTAVAALLTVGLRVKLPVNSGYPAICLAVVVLAWFAARQSGRARLDVLRLDGPVWDEDTGEFMRYNEDTGEFSPYRDDDTGYPPPRPGAGDRAPRWSGDDTGGFGAVGPDTDFSTWFRDDTGGLPADTGGFPADTGGFPADTGGLPADTGGFPAGDTGEYGFGSDPGLAGSLAPMPGAANGHQAVFETGDVLPVAGGYRNGDGGYRNGAGPVTGDTSRFYGQIAIYTLLDGRADDFDQLAQRVVEQVQASEPGTLVYVVHGVPSAPMQRILYEVYQDEAAFAEHARQPHVQRFEEERKPCVLATNVIELGVRHAKFTQGMLARREAGPYGNGAR